jgi:hypothetical protein
MKLIEDNNVFRHAHTPYIDSMNQIPSSIHRQLRVSGWYRLTSTGRIAHQKAPTVAFQDAAVFAQCPPKRGATSVASLSVPTTDLPIKSDLVKSCEPTTDYPARVFDSTWCIRDTGNSMIHRWNCTLDIRASIWRRSLLPTCDFCLWVRERLGGRSVVDELRPLCKDIRGAILTVQALVSVV